MFKSALLSCVFSVFLLSCQSSYEHNKVLPEYRFSADDNYLDTIEQAQQLAKQQNKLLMLVLGASWCHDSSDLAQGFSRPEVDTILKQRFVTQFIDVAYFEDKHHIPQSYGYPGYFATPTVLIIDPNSKQLVNRDSIKDWQSPSSMGSEGFTQYFSEIGTTVPAPVVTSKQLSAFIQQQIKRLRQGFDHLRPIWRSVRLGEVTDTSELELVATQLWEFRTQLQKDIHQLEAQLAKDQQADLTLPSYASFSWE